MFPYFLVQLLVALIVIGLLLYVVSIIPMDPTIRQIIRVVVIVFVCIWMIYLLMGYFPAGASFPRR
jgi:hypothetical protein